jgi:adenosine deaminase CECR1
MKKHNIYFMEIRTKLNSCIDDNGNVIPILTELEELYKYKKYFMIIVQSSKCKKDSCKYFEKIIKLTLGTKFFEFIRGYDLVGDENKCINLKFFYNNLKELKEKYNINYYMHAGEVINGKNSDVNIEYAIKLKCIRIGHGIYAFNHVQLLNDIIKNNICLEICPLSNKILYNYNVIESNINNNSSIVTIGSDDDNKFRTNLSSDFLYLYNSGININLIKILLLNSSKFNPYFDIHKFNDDYDNFMKLFK